ncbi:MAG: hypothetical protein IJH65_13820 [Methanobrevibacter sp.]|nr:hypothetical protein [Methanobrevibacter sp.]
MEFENMDLEQLIDNEVNVGEHISMDDILDNAVEDDSADESCFVLNEAQANQVIKGLVNDPAITDEYWDEKVQHTRDDICFQLEQYGCIDVKEIADFHGSAVYQMVEKYL